MNHTSNHTSSNPLLSILLPAYNAEEFLIDAIESILNQTFQNFELLLIDDASEDTTWSKIQQYASDKRVRVFQNEENKGKNKSVNDILSECQGKYISVHDADDISVSSRFEKQIDLLEQRDDIALCGTNFISFKNNRVIEKSEMLLEHKDLLLGIQERSVFHGPTTVFRKEIIDTVGGLYRHFEQGEDIDFTMRVIEKYTTANLKEHLYLYRFVATSLTKKVEGYSIKRMVNTTLLFHLQKQRREMGEDMLMTKDVSGMQAYAQECQAKYEKNEDKVYRFGAFHTLSLKMYGNSIRLAQKAFFKRPFKLLNLKCLVYVLWKSVHHSVKDVIKPGEPIGNYRL